MASSMTLEGASLVVRTPYSPELVSMIKTLPATDRKWDGARRVWMVDPRHGQILSGWIAQYLGEMVMVPQTSARPKIETRIIEVRYIGQCKERGDGTASAFGWTGSDWGVIFPENVLREWFEGTHVTARFGGDDTLYQILGTNPSADEADIKSAYRRMARQWHPDVCKEPDAADRFRRIQEAYSVLGDPTKRAKYNAGLVLQSLAQQAPKQYAAQPPTYRSPLLCGLIMVEGQETLGRFVVSKIFEWLDIQQNGRTLVTSWPMGAKFPVEAWV